MGQPLYLRQNIQVEPLVDQWYAWSHLIQPATAARNLTNRHLKIMDSYISSPQIHANAVRNPKLLGGPFIDYDGKRVNEIRDLRERTKKQRADLIALSSALSELDTFLKVQAKGFSLQPLYPNVPACLRGYVELVYDLNSNPSYRLIEPLLYRSKYYDRYAQSLMLSVTRGDDRPFILSTPRLPAEDTLHCAIQFTDKRVDELFRLKTEPRGWAEIQDILGCKNDDASRARSFFTPEAPPRYIPYNGSGARWRYFGHACILLESAGASVLFDPVLSYTYESDIARYTYSDLPETIDYVVITHNHQDHILFETLLQIRHKVKTVVVPRGGFGALQDPSLKLILENCGFENVIELGPYETIPFGNASLTGLPFLGEHADLDIRTKLAYLVRFGEHSLLFGADSCNIESQLYEHVHRDIGDVDVLFLGMECDGAPLSWLYGPLLSQHIERGMDESRRLSGSNYEQAMDIVNRFHCKEVYVYAMGQEPWLNHIMSIKYSESSRPIVESNKLLHACKQQGIAAERLFGEKEILVA
jgi:L-ascorbate metabolism protein UlaG (beta-lactamase superfamily)